MAATIEQSRISDLIGKLKVATVVTGIFDLGLAGGSFVHGIAAEEFVLAIICIAFILSLIFVVLIIASVLPITEIWKKIDMIYHFILSVLLAIAMVVQLVQILEHKSLSGGQLTCRCFVLLLTLVNTSTYGYIGFYIYRTPL